MTITVVASAAAGKASGTTLTINKPTGTADGDLMICTTIQAGGTYIAALTGWTLIAQATGSGGTDTPFTSVFAKVANGEGASYGWTTANRAGAGIITTFRGADGGYLSNFTTQGSGSATTAMNASALTTVYPNSMVVWCGGSGVAASTFSATTQPSALTAANTSQVGGGAGVFVNSTLAAAILASPGATGTTYNNGTASVSSGQVEIMVELRLALGGALFFGSL